MSKSLLAIGGIGIAGCVLLSSMMKELASQQPPKRPAWLATIEAQYREQLVGHLATHEEDDGGAERVVVDGMALDGCDRGALARAIADSANQLLSQANALTEVQVTLRDSTGERPQSATVARGRRPR